MTSQRPRSQRALKPTHCSASHRWGSSPTARASSQIIDQVVSSTSIPSIFRCVALRNSGSPGSRISSNPGATRLDFTCRDQCFHLVVVGLPVGKVRNVVHRQKHAVADHLALAGSASLPAESASQKLHHQAQRKGLCGQPRRP